MATTHRILLTGANGYVGSHILRQLLSSKPTTYTKSSPSPNPWSSPSLKEEALTRLHIVQNPTSASAPSCARKTKWQP